MNIEEAHRIAGEIKKTFFSLEDRFRVDKSHQTIPLVAAKVHLSTRSFSAGQVVYIYDGYWGMAERVKVIGRYRRKNRFILGVCPIKNLSDYRPKIVYQPQIIKKLLGETLEWSYYKGFWDKDNRDKYIFKVKNVDGESQKNNISNLSESDRLVRLTQPFSKKKPHFIRQVFSYLARLLHLKKG